MGEHCLGVIGFFGVERVHAHSQGKKKRSAASSHRKRSASVALFSNSSTQCVKVFYWEKTILAVVLAALMITGINEKCNYKEFLRQGHFRMTVDSHLIAEADISADYLSQSTQCAISSFCFIFILFFAVIFHFVYILRLNSRGSNASCVHTEWSDKRGLVSWNYEPVLQIHANSVSCSAVPVCNACASYAHIGTLIFGSNNFEKMNLHSFYYEILCKKYLGLKNNLHLLVLLIQKVRSKNVKSLCVCCALSKS